jgi:hypothetical protein
MGNPNTGHYKCPRCESSKAYESEENTGAMGLTLNTGGPVDPTIIRATTSIVMRCSDCGEKTKWFDSAETIAYKAKRDATASTVICYVAGVIFLLAGIYVIGLDISGTTGATIFTFAMSAIFLFFGFVSSKG